MPFKNFFTKLTTAFGRLISSTHAKVASIAKTFATHRSPILTNHFKIKYEEKSNPKIISTYNRAFALIQKIDNRYIGPTMFCYRSGDWYIVEVERSPLIPDGYERTTDVNFSLETRKVYVMDMSHDQIIQRGDINALTNVFEYLITRKPHQNDEEEREYLYHITTILLAAVNPYCNLIKPMKGDRFPEEVDFPKYEVQGDTLIYKWFELSRDMAYYIIKHTIIWNGKEATHKASIIDMSAPEKTWP